MSSRLQDRFFEKLKDIFGYDLKYITDYRPRYLQNENKTSRYEIDVFVHCLGIGFEVQGDQHFKRVSIFHNDPDVSRYNDEKKKELAKKRKIFIIEIFSSEVELNREALKNLIIKRGKTILPPKRFSEMIRTIVKQSKVRKRLKSRLPKEEYESLVEQKILDMMEAENLIPFFS